MQWGRIYIYVFWVVGAIYFFGSPATSNESAANVGAIHPASPHVVVATLVIPPIISPDITNDEPAFLGDSPARFSLHDETAGGISRSAFVQGQTGYSRGE